MGKQKKRNLILAVAAAIITLAGGATSTSQVASNVIAGMKKKSVSNVLMHDIKGYTVNAIDEIVSWGLANGYTFRAMTSSSPMVQFSPKN